MKTSKIAPQRPTKTPAMITANVKVLETERRGARAAQSWVISGPGIHKYRCLLLPAATNNGIEQAVNHLVGAAFSRE